MKRIPGRFVLAVTAVSLGLAGPAYAQTSQQGYSTQGGGIQGQVGAGDSQGQVGSGGGDQQEVLGQERTASDDNVAAARSAASERAAGASGGDAGRLPFTGLDLALLLAVGTGLLALGLGVRRLGRSPSSA